MKKFTTTPNVLASGSIFIIILLTFCSAGRAQEESFLPLIEFRDFIRKLSQPHPRLHLSFAEITYEVADTKHGSPFGKMMREKLIKLAGSVDNVTAAALEAAPKLSSGVRHYRVEGNYWEAGGVMRMQLLFVPADPQAGLARQSVKLWVERPRNIEVLSSAAVKRTFEHWRSVYRLDPSFKVELTTTVEPGGQIAIGRPLTIQLKANRDCYFVLMNRDAGGHLEAIYPRGEEDNRLTLGVPRDFKDIRLQEPYGLEVLLVYASKQPIRPAEALAYFAEYYNKYISKLFADRDITRKDVVVDWTFLYSRPAQEGTNK